MGSVVPFEGSKIPDLLITKDVGNVAEQPEHQGFSSLHSTGVW